VTVGKCLQYLHHVKILNRDLPSVIDQLRRQVWLTGWWTCDLSLAEPCCEQSTHYSKALDLKAEQTVTQEELLRQTRHTPHHIITQW